MPDYSNAKIYKITNTVNDKIYIGSTTKTLVQRMCVHRCHAKIKKSRWYKAMIRHGVENFTIKLIIDYPCENKEELYTKEFKTMGQYISKGIVLYNSTTVDGKMSEETKAKLSKLRQGTGNCNYGKLGAANARFKRGCVAFESGINSWRFSWRENGKQLSKCFSVNKFGYDEARQLAGEYPNKIYPTE